MSIRINWNVVIRRLHEVDLTQQLMINSSNFNTFKFFSIYSLNFFVSLSKCIYFNRTFELASHLEFILVQCKGYNSKDLKKKGKTVYYNAHAIVRRQYQMINTFENFKILHPDQRPLSILMLGIDSISRLNLIRAMPHTAQYLFDNGWMELKGYNKVSNLKL